MEVQVYTFRWIIENLPYCWHKKEHFLASPDFVVNSLNKSKWHLRIFPRGSHLVPDFSIVYLERNDDHPDDIHLTFDILYLAENGTSIRTVRIEKHRFSRKGGCRINGFLTHEEVFRNNKVILCCKIWNTLKLSEVGYCSAITNIGKTSNSFLWEIKDFSNLKSGDKKTIDVKSTSTGIQLLSLTFLVVEGLGYDENLCIEAMGANEKIRIQAFTLFILDNIGDKLKCNLDKKSFCTIDNRFLFPIVFSKRQLMEKSDKFLAKNSLRLLCELSYSTGDVSEEIATSETCLLELKPIDNDLKASVKNVPYVLNGLASLYHDQIMCDVKLRTKTDVFPCHRIILSAASSVFRSMFTSPMKEGTSEFVDIPDLEDHIVRRMLLYLYTGTLEDLCWESAFKLYAAADMYQILPLKHTCGLYLADNVSVTNACEVLIFVDLYQDSELKRFIQNFILDHSSIIISGNDWKKLMNTNTLLAAETMHLKWLNE